MSASRASAPDSAAPPRREGLAARLFDRARPAPGPAGLLARRVLITATKWLLPLAALALLTAVAVWPEWDRAADHARLALRRVKAEVEGGTMIQPRYRGVDQQDRPYMVTAESARQETPDRISLVQPKADIGTKDGRWLMLQSREGTYAPRSSQVDLRGDVVLYRDDGSTARTESASIDLKGGAATGAEPISVSGPFGTIEAEGGFAVLDKGDIVQFSGPAKALLNGASSPRAHSPGAPAQGTSR